MFKKHNWKNYGYTRSGNILKIEVCDESEKRIDWFISDNNEKHRRIGRILKDKYGIDLSPTVDIKDIEELKEEKEKKDWLNPDFDL